MICAETEGDLEGHVSVLAGSETRMRMERLLEPTGGTFGSWGALLRAFKMHNNGNNSPTTAKPRNMLLMLVDNV